jgi:hypothetical protein
VTSGEPLSGAHGRARPKPCKRYANMLLKPKFLAHLHSCHACKAVVAYLIKKSEIKLYSYPNRN